MFTNVSIVCFNSFSWCKVAQKRVSEDANIRPPATLIWTIEPNNVTSRNTESHFITKSRLLELMAVEQLTMLGNPEVCAINSRKAVIAPIIFEPILPYDLQQEQKEGKELRSQHK
jgi:hypothetical protein